MKKEINLMLGDNMESLKKIADNSVDSIVTDPPYGLSFMNKKWDYEVPSIDFWKEALRVLKPGGHVLSFGGTRTYHRMVVNMEDAGFEIRDQIMWIYGSGFPKSLNIGKAFDKKNGNDREVIGNRGVGYNDSEVYGNGKDEFDITKGSSQYEGWGTGLKPANEPICLARKPLSEKTIVDNVIKWGTGGINVDGCRIGTEPIKSNGYYNLDNDLNSLSRSGSTTKSKDEYNGSINEGRFPANILFDEEAVQVLDEQSGISKAKKERTGKTFGGSDMNDNVEGKWPGDNGGGASRFFYVAKVSKKERNLGLDDSNIEKNNHPTLKPINLMSYLIKLITPEGGVVLDPFMGSGSCGIAAALSDYKYIGMELDEDYFQIAEQRIKEYKQYRKLIKNGTR